LILRAAAAGMMTVTSVDLLGATMQTRLLTIRNVKIVSSLAFCLAMLPASGHAFTQDDQQRLCTGDVFRLCSSEIANRSSCFGEANRLRLTSFCCLAFANAR
jgi:hypothetical protein